MGLLIRKRKTRDRQREREREGGREGGRDKEEEEKSRGKLERWIYHENKGGNFIEAKLALVGKPWWKLQEYASVLLLRPRTDGIWCIAEEFKGRLFFLFFLLFTLSWLLIFSHSVLCFTVFVEWCGLYMTSVCKDIDEGPVQACSIPLPLFKYE